MTLKQTIASCMTDVKSDNILNLAITSTSSSSINASYSISIQNTVSSYSDLTTELRSNVQNGVFTNNLQNFSYINNAIYLQSASSTSITIGIRASQTPTSGLRHLL